LKKLSLIFTFLVISLAATAQKNYHKLKIGAGAGAALAFADLNKKTISFVGYGTLDFQITPFVSIGGEFQKGELAGGDIIFDPYNRQFINSFIATTVNLKISLGEFMTDYQRRNDFLNFLSGVYFGAGVGVVRNKISNVRYYGDNYFNGEDESSDEVIPINIGVDFNILDRWGYNRYGVNVNLQNNFTLGEGLDGYDAGAKRKDIYTYLSVGFRYHFGFMGVDKRR
jgi:hypothetical protein